MSTPHMRGRLAALTDTPLALKEVLRDIILNICAFCHHGEKPGYPIYTSIDEDAYGPDQGITLGINVPRYLTTVLNDVHLDKVRISIPSLGSADGTVRVLIHQLYIFAEPVTLLGADNAGPGTMKFGFADFAPVWQSTPLPDGARIDVLTTYLATPGGPSGVRSDSLTRTVS